MPLAEFALWSCSLLGWSCGAAEKPDVSIIQSAYEREAAKGSPLHDKGLEVIEASCDDAKAGQYLCQVTFLSKDDPAERLYFDVVALAGAVRDGSSTAVFASAEQVRLPSCRLTPPLRGGYSRL
jgi:hypothetical protein